MYKIWERVKHSQDNIFYVTSLSVFLMCLLATMGGDDVSSMRVQDGTVVNCLMESINLYQTWSSRVLVNFIVFVLRSRNTFFWSVYMGLSFYILQKAFSLLFVKKEEQGKYNILISTLVLSYSFAEISEVGWIATACTYFGPIAFGFMSLVPIKKVYEHKTIKWWEYGIYILCLIYGANNEQMMVVILSAYVVMTLYILSRKRKSLIIFGLTFLSILSLVFVLTCPGNHNRVQVELIMHNPTYDMLNFISKAELGATTAIRYLLFSNKVYVLFACVSFFILIFEKYDNLYFRIISSVPVLVVVLLGTLREITLTLYPSVEVLTREIPHNGLVNTQNAGGGV